MTPAERQARHKAKLRAQAEGGIRAAFRSAIRRVAHEQIVACTPGGSRWRRLHDGLAAVEALDDDAIMAHISDMVAVLIHDATPEFSPRRPPLRPRAPREPVEKR
jgi:hypothetical protein